MSGVSTIGFTGTSVGMTEYQKVSLKIVLVTLRSSLTHVLRHGDCTGADAQCHEIAKELGFKTIIHPPIKDDKRAFCDGDTILEPKQYLVRDDDIARECEVLVATPENFFEVIRSGTWTTVRYALKYDRPVLVIFPNGLVTQYLGSL